MKVPHLVQYQGSKRNLAPEILQYIPTHLNRLVEPFSGTAAITMACASKKIAEEYIINDLNKPLIDLFKIVIEQPEFSSKRYEEIWGEQHFNSIEHYYQTREKFNLTKDPLMFLYLLARCAKGAVRYNSDGLFNQSPDKRRKGTNPQIMTRNIFDISVLLKNKSKLYSLDYKTLLEMAMPGDIIYMDPPYQGVCGERDSRYFSGIEHNEFVLELEKLIKRGISFIVSYDGKCGNKTYGKEIPIDLGLEHIHLNAGRSSQATLLGKDSITFESLYITKDLLINKESAPKWRINNELF